MVQVSQTQRALTDLGKRLKAARDEWNWSFDDLAREVAKIRAMRNLDPHPVHSLRRQIIDFEKGRRFLSISGGHCSPMPSNRTTTPYLAPSSTRPCRGHCCWTPRCPPMSSPSSTPNAPRMSRLSTYSDPPTPTSSSTAT